MVFGKTGVLDATVVSIHRSFFGAMGGARRFASTLTPIEEWEVFPDWGQGKRFFAHPGLHWQGSLRKVAMNVAGIFASKRQPGSRDEDGRVAWAPFTRAPRTRSTSAPPRPTQSSLAPASWRRTRTLDIRAPPPFPSPVLFVVVLVERRVDGPLEWVTLGVFHREHQALLRARQSLSPSALVSKRPNGQVRLMFRNLLVLCEPHLLVD